MESGVQPRSRDKRRGSKVDEETIAARGMRNRPMGKEDKGQGGRATTAAGEEWFENVIFLLLALQPGNK